MNGNLELFVNMFVSVIGNHDYLNNLEINKGEIK